MNDEQLINAPPALDAIQRDTQALGFTMASEPKTGALLRAFAAGKPRGCMLELGTGIGYGTAWLLAGMDSESHLDSVDHDSQVSAVARKHLAYDPRVRFIQMDAGAFLDRAQPAQYDFIYSDAGPGKFSHLDQALALLKVGGIFFIDDLLPQPSWPEGHAPKVPLLIEDLARRPGFVSVQLAWASGLMWLVKTA